MRLVAATLLVALLAAAGCVFDSKQLTISYAVQPDSLAVVSTAPVVPIDIDLNENATYREHKAEIRGLSDFAFLGRLRNNGLTVTRVEFWVTADTTGYTAAADVRANGVKLWAGAEIPPRGIQDLDWNKSAGLIDRDALDILLRELQGDGRFTLYALGAVTGTTYSFAVIDAALVLVLATDS